MGTTLKTRGRLWKDVTRRSRSRSCCGFAIISGPAAALKLCQRVARWARRKRRNRRAEGHVRVLYAPNGEVLAEVCVEGVEDE
jgi:hypothetical protein